MIAHFLQQNSGANMFANPPFPHVVDHIIIAYLHSCHAEPVWIERQLLMFELEAM
jgi:hypothetical protein